MHGPPAACWCRILADARIAFTSISMPARAHACFTTAWVFWRTALMLVWECSRSRWPSLARTPSGPDGARPQRTARGPGGPRDPRVVRHDAPDLDAAEAVPWDPPSDLYGLFPIARLDEVVAAELLLRLGEGAVGGGRRPMTHPHGGGGLHRVEGRGAHEVPAPAGGPRRAPSSRRPVRPTRRGDSAAIFCSSL